MEIEAVCYLNSLSTGLEPRHVIWSFCESESGNFHKIAESLAAEVLPVCIFMMADERDAQAIDAVLRV